MTEEENIHVAAPEKWMEQWNLWQPNLPTEVMVTSGPFNVSEYIAGEFTELSYNPLYFYGLDHNTDTASTTDGPGGFDATLAIVAGAVGAAVIILVGGYVLMRQR